jgi:cell division protein FtsB
MAIEKQRRASEPGPRRGDAAVPRRGRAWSYVLLFLICLVMVDGLVGERGLIAKIRAERQYRELSQALAAAREENARLREEARRLREDPATIEEIARRELGLIRPGERLFIVKDVPPASPPAR